MRAKTIVVRILVGIMAVFAMVVAALIIWLATADWNALRGPIADATEKHLGRRLAIDGDLAVHWQVGAWYVNPTVTAQDVRLANAPWAGPHPMATLQSFDGKIALLPLLRGRIEVDHVRVAGLDLRLARRADGEGNWSFPALGPSHKKPSRRKGGESSFPLPWLKEVRATDVRVRYDDQAAKTTQSVRLASLTGGAATPQDPFVADARATVEKGGKLAAALPVTAHVEAGSFSRVKDDATYPVKADVRLGDASLYATLGLRMATATQVKAVDGDVKAVVKDPRPLLQALGKDVHGTLPALDAGGKVHWSGSSAALRAAEVSLGRSRLTGDTSVSWGDKPDVSLDWAIPSLYVDDVKAFFPPEAQKPARTLAKGRKGEAAQKGPFFSDKPLPLDALSLANADAKIRFGKVVSDVTWVTDGAVDLRLRNGLLTVNPSRLRLADGDVSFSGRFDARREKAPDVAFKAKLEGVQIQRFVKEATPKEKKGALALKPVKEEVKRIEANTYGRLSGDIALTSQGPSPHALASHLDGHMGFAMDQGHVSDVVMELMGLDVGEALASWISGDKGSNLRCTLVSLDAKQGRIETDKILIAATSDYITGKGFVDLGSEEVDITLKAHPKDFSLGAFRAPLEITGKLGDLKIGAKTKELAGLRAAAAALLAFLNPAAAVIPLVEPGLAKGGECQKVIGEVKAIEAKAAH